VRPVPYRPGPRAVLFATGVVAMLGQVTLLREGQVLAFGNELALVVGLALWLLAGAVGALLGARTRASEGAVRALFLAAAALLPLAAAWARGARPLLGAVPGADLAPGPLALALLACLAPAALALGALFAVAARRAIAAGGSAAGAYALESAGALVGGLVATLTALSLQGNLGGLLFCALLALLNGWPAGRVRSWLGVLAVPIVIFSAPGLDRALTRWTHPDLLATRDTPYGRVTLAGRLGQVAVFEDDALAYESQGPAAEPLVHVAAAQRARVARVLVLGGAAQGLLPEVLAHGPARVDDVELDRDVLALVAPRLPGRDHRALADPRVRLVYADPRRFLRAGGERYDLVLDAMPAPASGRANRCYTREFFAACAARLEPAGVLALRLPGAENLWTPVQERRAASVRRALADVFPDVLVLPGATDLFLASRAPLERNPDSLAARLAARGVHPRLVTAPWLRYQLTNDRVADVARRLAGSTAPANRDARPVSYAATLMLWLARFSPALARLDLPAVALRDLARSAWTWGVAAALALAALLARRGERARRALLAAAAGFAGMALEAALLLGYQVRAGVLWQDLGLLLTAFMAGLALGAMALDRILARAPRPQALAALAGALLAALAAAVALSPPASLIASAAALLAAGFLVAGLFACAVAPRAPAGKGAPADAGALIGPIYAADLVGGCAGAGALVGPIYAADLVGGCVGALAAALLAIPFAGLPATALLAAAGAGLALLLA
jgi:spermidine synthase